MFNLKLISSAYEYYNTFFRKCNNLNGVEHAFFVKFVYEPFMSEKIS